MKQFQQLALLLLSFIVIVNTTNTSKISLESLRGFKCYSITNIQTPIRLTNDNKIQCFSLNGSECVKNIDSDKKCLELISKDYRKLIPITCDSSHKNESWCKEAKFFYFRKWHCFGETGLHTGIRLNKHRGDVECLSFNGRDCVWGKEGDRKCNKVQTSLKSHSKLKPLVCGDHHLRIYGSNGYLSNSGHWCKVGWAFFKFTGSWLCQKHTGLDTPIRLSNQGEVECASPNGRDCYWGMKSNKKCMNLILFKSDNLKSLKCGSIHKRLHGESGYNKNSHWCRYGYHLFYEKKIDITGQGRIQSHKIRKNMKTHLLNKSTYNFHLRKRRNKKKWKKYLESKWTRIKVKLRQSKAWKLLNSFSIGRIKTKVFWRDAMINGWHIAVSKSQWWRKYIKWLKKRRVNYQIIFSKIRKRLRKWIFIIHKTWKRLIITSIKKKIENKIKINKNRWKKITKRLKETDLIKNLQEFNQLYRVNIDKFLNLLRKKTFKTTLKNMFWWTKFHNWGKSQGLPILNILRRFDFKLKKIKKQALEEINESSYTNSKVNKSQLHKYLKNWAENKNIKCKGFWKKLKKFSQDNFKKFNTWKRLNKWAKKSNSECKTFWKKIKHRKIWKRIDIIKNKTIEKYITNINKARNIIWIKDKKANIKIPNKRWRKIIFIIKNTKFWKIFSHWSNKYNFNPKTFLKKLKNKSWKTLRKTKIWYRFKKWTIKNNIPIKKLIKNIKKVIQKERPKYTFIPKSNANIKIPNKRWRKIIFIIKNTKFWKIFSHWSNKYNFNPKTFLKKLKNKSWKTLRKTKIWYRFKKWTIKNNIPLKKIIKDIKKVLQKARRKYTFLPKLRVNPMRRINSKIPNKRWKKIFVKLKNTKCWKIFSYWSNKYNLNPKTFLKKLKNNTWKTAINTKLWFEFKNWAIKKNIPIKNLIKHVKKVVEKERFKYSVISKSQIFVGYRHYYKRLSIPKKKWVNVVKKIKNSKFWFFFKKWSKINKFNPKLLLKNIRKQKWTKIVKSHKWKTFILWTISKNIPIKKLIKRIKIVVQKARPNFSFIPKSPVYPWRINNNIPKKIWRKIILIIKNTKFWKIFSHWSNKYNFNPKTFLKKLKNKSWKTLRKTKIWYRFKKWTIKNNIPIKKLIKNIKKVVEKVRAKFIKRRFISQRWRKNYRLPKKIWNSLKIKIKKSFYYNLLLKWSHLIKLHSFSLLKIFRNKSIPLIVKNPVLIKFHHWAKSKRIKILKHLKKITKIIKKARLRFYRKIRLIRGPLSKKKIVIPFKKWKKAKKKLLKTLYFKILKKWGYKNNHKIKRMISIMRFMPLYIIKNLDLIKRFHKWASTKNIKIENHLKKVVKILKKYRRKIRRKNKFPKSKKGIIALPRRVWKKTLKTIKLTPFWKYFYAWATNKKYNLKIFLNIVRKKDFSKAVKSTPWFKNFISWSKNRNVPIHIYINKIKNLIQKKRLIYKYRQSIKKFKKFRGRRSKKISNKAWRKIIKSVSKLPLFKFLDDFIKKGSINANKFWSKLRKSSWQKAIKTAPWWRTFIKNSKALKIPIMKHIYKFRKVINNLKRKHSNARLNKLINKIPSPLWMKLQNRLKNTYFWQILMSWKRSIHLNLFWKGIHKKGVTPAIEKSEWFTPFKHYLNKNDINLQEMMKEFKKKIKSVAIEAKSVKKGSKDRERFNFKFGHQEEKNLQQQ